MIKRGLFMFRSMGKMNISGCFCKLQSFEIKDYYIEEYFDYENSLVIPLHSRYPWSPDQCFTS